MINPHEPLNPPYDAKSPQPPQKVEENRQLTLIIYILYGLGLFVGITAIIAVIINYVKRDEVRGTWLQSHFDWQIKTFWCVLIIGIIGTITRFILIGYVILFGLTLWYIYRMIKGFLAFNERRSIE